MGMTDNYDFLPHFFPNAKMRFQSFFILMTVQPCFFCLVVQRLGESADLGVAGITWTGPSAYSRFASSCSTSMASRAPRTSNHRAAAFIWKS